VIDNGHLTTWLLDLAAARQLKLKPTGTPRAARRSASPTTSNFYLEKGKLPVDELIGDIKSGLFITDLIALASMASPRLQPRRVGFLIENGKLGWPVSGITVAGNLKTCFKHDAGQRPAVQGPPMRRRCESKG